MSYLHAAREIAFLAHDGQKDRAGNPYFSHPHRVAEAFDDPTLKAVAYLHDVVEDSPYDLYDLAVGGLPREVIDAVDALTKRKDETYAAYIQRVAGNALARSVKIADLHDNMNLKRLPSVSAADWQRQEKYTLALAVLEGAFDR